MRQYLRKKGWVVLLKLSCILLFCEVSIHLSAFCPIVKHISVLYIANWKILATASTKKSVPPIFGSAKALNKLTYTTNNVCFLYVPFNFFQHPSKCISNRALTRKRKLEKILSIQSWLEKYKSSVCRKSCLDSRSSNLSACIDPSFIPKQGLSLIILILNCPTEFLPDNFYAPPIYVRGRSSTHLVFNFDYIQFYVSLGTLAKNHTLGKSNTYG